MIRIVKDWGWSAEDYTFLFSHFYTRIMKLPKKYSKVFPKASYFISILITIDSYATME